MLRPSPTVCAGKRYAVQNICSEIEIDVATVSRLGHGRRKLPESDLVACEVLGLQWLLNSPKLDAIAIDEDGWPVPMRVPDPRAFALHKVWLSGLSTRETIKKPRDFEQARIVARLVQENMPQLSFESTLTSLHGDVRKMLPLILAKG